jgi:hypothetical protein
MLLITLLSTILFSTLPVLKKKLNEPISIWYENIKIETKLNYVLYSRNAIGVLFIIALMSYENLNLLEINEGLSIYNGLLQITPISIFMEFFIALIGALILFSWPFTPMKASLAVSKNQNINPLYNEMTGVQNNVNAPTQSKKLNIKIENIPSFIINQNKGLINKEVNIINYYQNYLDKLKDYTLIIFFNVFGSLLLISSFDLISLYIAIELQSFSLYILATFYKESRIVTAAGLKYFLLGALSSCFILLGSALIYSFTGLTKFDSIYTFISSLNPSIDHTQFTFGLILIFLGLLFKIGAAPLHNWSPAKHFGKMLFLSHIFIRIEKWVKLSNSGELLKLLIPSYIIYNINGWSNNSDKVISQKMSESEMDNRGSKSNIIKRFVKEQRVNGSYFGNNFLLNLKLRNTLMGFKRNYHIKIPSKKLNICSYFTLINNNLIIPTAVTQQQDATECTSLMPWWLTGFTDAEGSFQISIRHDTRSKINWRVSPAFQIKLHIKDIGILEEIKNMLGVGTITKDKLNTANFNAWSIKDIQIIINHFDKYPLVTAKHSDYLIFKQCFEIIKSGEHLTEKGLIKILELKSCLNLGLSIKLKEAFPNIKPINRPEYTFKGIPNPWWVSGFVNGDGSFHIQIRRLHRKIKESNTILNNTVIYRSVGLTFAINLHSRDEIVLLNLVNYFKLMNDEIINIFQENKEDIKEKYLPIKNTRISKHFHKTKAPKESVYLYFRKISDIINIIIPFFKKYPLKGYKNLDFKDFIKVAKIIKSKEHLTSEGFNKIENINNTMNERRPWS